LARAKTYYSLSLIKGEHEGVDRQARKGLKWQLIEIDF